jgi:hypothetical protein
MAQFGRPISDITVNSWTDEGTTDNDGSLYTSIDEVTSDGDDSYILDAGANTMCEVELGDLEDPTVDTGFTLHLFMRSIGSGGPEKLDVHLMQGATTIATWNNQSNRSASYADQNLAVAEADAANIDDFTDLRVRMTGDSIGGSEEMRVTQVYLEIPDAPIASDSISAYINGADTASGSRPAYTKGQDSANDSISVYLNGQDTALDSIGVYTKGQNTGSDAVGAYLSGQDSASDSLGAYTKGQSAATDSLEVFLKGQDTASSSQDVYLKGSAAAQDSVTAFTTGAGTDPSISWAWVAIPLSQPLSASDSIAAFMVGQIETTDNVSVYTSGQDTAQDSASAYTRGSIDVQDSVSAYVHGSVDTSDAQSAYTHGKADAEDSVTAYTSGIAGLSDSVSAYLKGQDSSSDSVSAYTTGGVETSDTVSAYLIGILGAEDSVSAYLKGEDTASDSVSAFTFAVIRDSVSAYLFGQVLVTDAVSAYTEGFQAYVTSDVSAYMLGGKEKRNWQSAYTDGEPRRGSVSAYLSGVAKPDNSISAYLIGSDDDTDSISAYTNGVILSTSSVSAFCNSAQLTASSSMKVYLTSVVSSSVSAYLEGEITAVDYVELTSDDESLSFKFRVMAPGYTDGTLMKGARLRKTVGGGTDIHNDEIYQVWQPTIKVRHTEPETGYGTMANLESLYSYYGNVIWSNHYQQEFLTMLIGDLRKAIIANSVEGTEAWFFVQMTLIEIQ